MPGPLVLVVDDDRDTRELYRLIYEMAGYEMVEASSVGAALEACSRLRPDLVVTDWLLPDGTGLQLCEALQRSGRTRRIPKIAVTGLVVDRTVAEKARAAGVLSFLMKPIAPDALMEAVGQTLELRAVRRLRAAAVRIRRDARRVYGSAESQRQITTDLRAAAARLLRGSAARALPDVALILADDHGHYVAANERAESLTGYAPQELERMSVWDLTPQSQADRGLELWTRFIEAGMQEGRYVVRRRSGEAVEAQYVAIANVTPGLHLSALTAPLRQTTL